MEMSSHYVHLVVKKTGGLRSALAMCQFYKKKASLSLDVMAMYLVYELKMEKLFGKTNYQKQGMVMSH